jgi:hypothetical protein
MHFIVQMLMKNTFTIFNYKEHFSIIHNISCWCIALLNISFDVSCNTIFFLDGKILKPQKKKSVNSTIMSIIHTLKEVNHACCVI